jgi:DNA-directed RNA polymerase specialized sigma24 family protein
VTAVPEHGAALLALYDSALPEVYGYLASRCGDRALAEDLTSETFLAAAAARADAPRTIGWLIGIARHKLADHWRWRARQDRLLESVAGAVHDEDQWDAQLDVLRARAVTRQARDAAPGGVDPALPRRVQRPGNRRAARPHRARHRGVAGPGASGLPSRLRGEQ